MERGCLPKTEKADPNAPVTGETLAAFCKALYGKAPEPPENLTRGAVLKLLAACL